MATRFEPKVLVVDDDLSMLNLLGEVLTTAGARPHCVQSSRQAAEVVNREKYDGVFLDWRMPDMNGLELARHIRWSKSNSRCPIVMVTGVTEPDALRECFRAGITFFLQKPVNVDQIRQLFTVARESMLQEHLRYWRAPLDTEILCTWEMGAFPQTAKGRSINLSTTGMLVTLNLSPPAAVPIRVKFRLPEAVQSLHLSAFVVRMTADQKVGLRFVNLSEGDRGQLLQFARATFDSFPPGSQLPGIQGPQRG